MNSKMLKLKNEQGVVKKAPTGFSWTVLFFGMFPPLFRGDLKWALILLLVVMLGNLIFPAAGFVISLGFAFMYNDLYLNDLKEKGYKVMN